MIAKSKDTKTIQSSQASLMAGRRAMERDIPVRNSRDVKRRAACEADDAEWLRVYIPSVFTLPFTSDQKQVIEEIGHCLQFGLAKCIAAPRHDGKTSITRYLCLKYSLQRIEKNGLLVPLVPLTLLINATGEKAKRSLSAMKWKLRAITGPLYEDYELECDVANYVGRAPAKCNNVTVGGQRVRVEWGAESMILPSFEDSGAMGGMVAAMGITSNEIQGFNLYDVRPRFVALDDLDDRDSLASKDGGSVAGKIETIVDENCAGLGGPGEPLGMVMLCTIPSRHSVAFKYSDPIQKPSWSGIRLKKIKQWPTRKELWDAYIEKRENGKQLLDASGRPIDKHGRQAHTLLLANYESMHEGAEVSNQEDYIHAILPDGSQTQVSALQNCYDYIADKGLASFLTEYQNDPPDDQGPEESGITPAIVASRVNGYEQKAVPASCSILVAGIDVGKYWLHWVVVAFSLDGIGFVVDYGIKKVLGVSREDTEQLTMEEAIRTALLGLREDWQTEPYFRESDGEEMPLSLVLVDSGSGLHKDAVYEFSKAVGGKPFVPAKGIGKVDGTQQFRMGKAKSGERIIGTGWAKSWQPLEKVWLHDFDADYWKRFVHQRFMTPTLDEAGAYRRGSLSIFAPDLPNQHKNFGRHIAAEIWSERMDPRKGLIKKWVRPTGAGENHQLDAMAMACAAGSMCGIRVVGEAKERARKVTLQELAERAKRAG